MEETDLDTILEHLRDEPPPASLPDEPSGEEIAQAMLAVPQVEQLITHLVGVGVGYEQIDQLDSAREAYVLAEPYLRAWMRYREAGLQMARDPFTNLNGNFFHRPALFFAQHDEGRLETALRFMEQAQDLDGRIASFIQLHVELLLRLDRRAEAVEMLALHWRRYPEDEELQSLYQAHQPAMEAFVETHDDSQAVDAALRERQIAAGARQYLLGQAEQWPDGSYSFYEAFEALVECGIPNADPMMQRLLKALGQDGGWQLDSFHSQCLADLADLAEAYRLALVFLEGTGIQGVGLVANTLSIELTDEAVQGIWQYLDKTPGRQPACEALWRRLESRSGRAADIAQLLLYADPQAFERIERFLETADHSTVESILPKLGDEQLLKKGYLRICGQWLTSDCPKKAVAARVRRWLTQEADEADEDDLLAELHAALPRDTNFPMDVRSWRSLPADETFRRASRLSCSFDANAICVQQERTHIAAANIDQLKGYLSTSEMIEVLLSEVISDESFYDPNSADDFDPEASDEDNEWTRPPLDRRLGQKLEALVRAHPEAAQVCLRRLQLERYSREDEVDRGLALLVQWDLDRHRSWILAFAQKVRKQQLKRLLALLKDDEQTLAWARDTLASPESDAKLRHFAAVICATQQDRRSIPQLLEAYAALPEVRPAVGEMLCALADPPPEAQAFRSRAAFAERAETLPAKVGRWPLRKGHEMIALHWADGAPLSPAGQHYLIHCLVRGPQPKSEAGCLLSHLAPEDTAELAYRLYAGGQNKAKQEWIATLAMDLADERLTPLLEKTIVDCDRKVESVHFLDRRDRALELIRGLAKRGAQDSLARLAHTVWDPSLQAELRAHLQQPPAPVTSASLLATPKQGQLFEPSDPEAETWFDCEGHVIGASQLRRMMKKAGWRIGAIDREGIFQTYYWELPALGQGVELSFDWDCVRPINPPNTDRAHLGRLVFYRLGTQDRPRDFPKGDYLATTFDEPPLRLQQVDPLFFHRAVTLLQTVMKKGEGFDPEWQNRY